MPNTAIKVSHLTKVYKLYDKPIDRLKESLHPLKKKYHKDFYALNDVSFEIKKGETVGIIGKNGAGKSTLLKIITGVLTPSSGHVHVNGRIASLLELGAGFNPEYTGIENIYLQGTLMGYTQGEMEVKIDEILAFADIGDFVHQPVKMYSSGMFARLAFAVAINVEPDILIVDEALSVGDMRFQQKCYRKFREFQEAKKTILFVTHDTATIINYCTHTIWINSGKKEEEGQPDLVCKKYISLMSYSMETIESSLSSIDDKFEMESVQKCESFGDGSVEIIGVNLIDFVTNNSIRTVKNGQYLKFLTYVKVRKSILNPGIGIRLTDTIGNHIFSITSYVDEWKFELDNEKIYQIEVLFEFPFIKNDTYCFTVAISDGTQLDHIQNHWINDALVINVHSGISMRYNMGICTTKKASYNLKLK